MHISGGVAGLFEPIQHGPQVGDEERNEHLARGGESSPNVETTPHRSSFDSTDRLRIRRSDEAPHLGGVSVGESKEIFLKRLG